MYPRRGSYPSPYMPIDGARDSTLGSLLSVSFAPLLPEPIVALFATLTFPSNGPKASRGAALARRAA